MHLFEDLIKLKIPSEPLDDIEIEFSNDRYQKHAMITKTMFVFTCIENKGSF